MLIVRMLEFDLGFYELGERVVIGFGVGLGFWEGVVVVFVKLCCG